MRLFHVDLTLHIGSRKGSVYIGSLDLEIPDSDEGEADANRGSTCASGSVELLSTFPRLANYS